MGSPPVKKGMRNSENSFLPTRRSVLGLLAATAVHGQTSQPAGTQPQRSPRQDADTVFLFVRLAHSDRSLDKVAEMVAQEPKLVYATWDWGGGDWETGLGGAAHTGSHKMARFLLEKGARIDAYCAAMLGQHDVVAALVAAGPEVVNARGPHGYSLLYHAAGSGDVAIVELLKPHLAAPARDFNQALSAAVRDGHAPMTRWLLENGVTDPNQGDGFAKRPLVAALQNGFNDVAEELRKHGATEQ